MGIFDPTTFASQTIEGANDTVRIPVEEGEYPAIIDKHEFRSWTSKDGTQSGIALDILWSIQDQAQVEKTGMAKALVKQGLMFDLNAAGGIDTGKGKNIALGKLREALSLNHPSKPFSFDQLDGQMAKVRVKHRLVDDDVFADVKGVTKLA